MANRPLSYEEIEAREIKRIEAKEKEKAARESAKEKVRLGLKYKESDFNLSENRLKELRKKERNEKRISDIKETSAKVGKGLFTTIFKKTSSDKPGFLKGRKVNLTGSRMDLTRDSKEKKRMRFI